MNASEHEDGTASTSPATQCHFSQLSKRILKSRRGAQNKCCPNAPKARKAILSARQQLVHGNGIGAAVMLTRDSAELQQTAVERCIHNCCAGAGVRQDRNAS